MRRKKKKMEDLLARDLDREEKEGEGGGCGQKRGEEIGAELPGGLLCGRLGSCTPKKCTPATFVLVATLAGLLYWFICCIRLGLDFLC